MNDNDFNNHLQFAKNNEQFINNVLKGWGYSAVTYNNGNCWDSVYYSTTTGNYNTLEYKADALAIITGNVAIEFQSNGKESGISTTKADTYIITTNNICFNWSSITKIYGCTIYVISVDILKQLALNAKTVQGGHNNLSSFYLLPLSELAPFAKTYNFTYNYVIESDLAFYNQYVFPKLKKKLLKN